MNNKKRMAAVIAASGLVLGATPAVANAQSELLGLNLDLLNGSVGVDLGAALGSEGGELPTESLSGGSEGLNTDSLSGGSEGLNTDSLSGGSEGGSTELQGSLTDITGSTNGGSEGLNTESLSGGSEGLDTGSLTTMSADLDTESLSGGSEGGSTELQGSLTDITGSTNGGSEGLDTESLGTGSDGLPTDSLGTGSEGLGSDAGGSDVIVEGSSGSIDDAGPLLAAGALAAGSIGLGLAVSGGVNLPPLPEINVGAVCNLPQPAIDFLKSNGSMEQHECEPEEEQNP